MGSIPWGEIVSGLTGFGGSILGDVIGAKSQQKTNTMNKNMFILNHLFENQQYGYMKDQNALTQEREDTAMQRRVADANAAGIHKTLAAGGQAQAQMPSMPNFGNAQPQLQDKAVNVGNAIQAGLHNALLAAQIKNIDADTNQKNAETSDIEPAAQDRRATIQNMKEYQQAIINGNTSDRQLTEALAMATNALKARELGQKDISLGHDSTRVENDTRRVANDTARLAIQSMLDAGRSELIKEQIFSEIKAGQLSSARIHQINRDLDLAVKEYERSVYESDRAHAKSNREYAIDTIINTVFRAAELPAEYIKALKPGVSNTHDKKWTLHLAK